MSQWMNGIQSVLDTVQTYTWWERMSWVSVVREKIADKNSQTLVALLLAAFGQSRSWVDFKVILKQEINPELYTKSELMYKLLEDLSKPHVVATEVVLKLFLPHCPQA